MTESEWLVSDCCLARIEWLLKSGKTSDRKCLLFAVHCAHRTWQMRSEDEHVVYDKVEHYAEGEVTWDELREVVRPRTGTARKHLTWLRQIIKNSMGSTANYAYCRVFDTLTVDHGPEAIKRLAEELGLSESSVSDPRDASLEACGRDRDFRLGVFRDLFGNPFRSALIDPAWLSTVVVDLGGAIYEERAFDRLPELAAALEVEGCQDAEILGHCRSEDPHFRGCWVLDALLGRS